MSDAAGGGGGEPAIGSEFAGHRIDAVLGPAGMGVVYRALQLALDRPRGAQGRDSGPLGERALPRAVPARVRLAASIEHPNVIPVHEAGESGGRLYLSMRLVEGADLRELVASSGPLTQPTRSSLADGRRGARRRTCRRAWSTAT